MRARPRSSDTRNSKSTLSGLLADRAQYRHQARRLSARRRQHLPAKVPRGSDSAIVSLVIDERDRAAEFDGVYPAPAPAVAERIWREVFGDEYPEGVDPNSYVTVSELGRFAEELRVGEGDLLLDAACGGSQVQILPPLLERPRKAGPFVFSPGIPKQRKLGRGCRRALPRWR
jgi:hypothetical protein